MGAMIKNSFSFQDVMALLVSMSVCNTPSETEINYKFVSIATDIQLYYEIRFEVDIIGFCFMIDTHRPLFQYCEGHRT